MIKYKMKNIDEDDEKYHTEPTLWFYSENNDSAKISVETTIKCNNAFIDATFKYDLFLVSLYDNEEILDTIVTNKIFFVKN